MNVLTNALIRFGRWGEDLDYHLVRASLVFIFIFFGYQKWFEYEAQALIPYISNGPLLSWMYPVFGLRGTCWFLGVSEWTFGALLFLASGTKRPECSARLAVSHHSWVPQPSFRSCRTAGQHPPAVSLQ